MEDLALYVGITLNFCFMVFVPKARQVLFWASLPMMFLLNLGVVLKVSVSSNDLNYAYFAPYLILLFGTCIQASSQGFEWIHNKTQTELKQDEEDEIRRAVRFWNQDRKRVELLGINL